jgi:hypothetical protein
VLYTESRQRADRFEGLVDPRRAFSGSTWWSMAGVSGRKAVSCLDLGGPGAEQAQTHTRVCPTFRLFAGGSRDIRYVATW